MRTTSVPDDRRVSRRHRLAVALAGIVVTSVAVGSGAMAVIGVRGANAELFQLSSRNVARLDLLGELRGQQARISDGVANLLAPAPPVQKDQGRADAARAAATMDRMLPEYQRLLNGTPGQGDLDELIEVWRLFYNGMTVHVLGGAPHPGVELLPGPEGLGRLAVRITDALDALAERERADAAAVADRQRATDESTVRQIGTFLAVGLAFAAAMAVLAVRAAAARRRGEQRFRALVQSSSDVIHVISPEGQRLYISPSAQRVMGFRPEELAADQTGELAHPDDRDQVVAAFIAALAQPGREHHVEARVRHADGTWHWHEIVARNLIDDPAVRGIVVNHRDINERREFEDRLAYDASHDGLTGLANRAAFLAGLRQALDDADRRHRRTAVLYVDLNGFKRVNDTWGHEVGDGLLVAVGDVLQRSVLGADTVARLGGDEFGIVLTRIDVPAHAHAVARRIIGALAEPLDAAGQPVLARASVGIAVSGPDCTDAETLLRRADVAMYHVKRQRINGWCTYRDELRTDAGGAPTATDLDRAIGAGELRLQYQPIVALHSGEMLGVEALVRWQHPTLGLIGPHEFIPLAEASGLIGALGAWVLEEACGQVQVWRRRNGPGRRLDLSINLSPRQLDDGALVASVLAILERTGLDARDLIFEITEDALVNDDCAIPTLTELRGHGIRLALDDFGTGYSSLRYLTNLPVDILKLDRCFVAELNGTPEGSAVAEAVIRLSQALNLDTVAEGIETDAQATELTLLGYPLAQGYHFARPLDPERIEELLDGAFPGGWPGSSSLIR